MAGALHGQQYDSAWAALAELLGANTVELLRDVPGQCSGTSGPIHVFDRTGAPPLLRRFLERASAHHGMCAWVRSTSRGGDILVASRATEPFTPGECAWMELVTGPVRSALEVGDRLASPIPALATAAQLARMLPIPGLLVDEAGRCLERSEGLGAIDELVDVPPHSGRLAFRKPAAQLAWKQALLDAHATATRSTFAIDGPPGTRWQVHIVPFPCTLGVAGNTPLRLLLVVFQNAGAVPITTVQASTRLTKAELEVLAALLNGHAAKQIARSRGASVNTVRSQITSILAKTGHQTQKQLMASFGNSAFGGLPPINGSNERT
jgi:DNA-binding CsgD family transcriptional regulator